MQQITNKRKKEKEEYIKIQLYEEILSKEKYIQ